MSGERPAAPLWPEGLRKELKLPPVENQRKEALPKGVSTPVAKQPELRKPGDKPAIQSESTPAEENVVFSNEPASSEPKPKRKYNKRQPLPKPQPRMGEHVTYEGKPFNFILYPYDLPPFPQDTDPNWESYSKSKKFSLNMEYILGNEAMRAFAKGSHEARRRYLRDLGYMPVGEPNNEQGAESSQQDLPDRHRVRRRKKRQGGE
jgi:hypothetical protein